MAVTRRLRARIACAVIGCLSFAGRCQAQTLPAASPTSQSPAQGEFVNRVLKDDQGEHKYVVYVPANYKPDKKWPVILYLHGACNRGTDGRSQLVSGLAPSIRLRLADYPFIVVFPQCEDVNSRVLAGWTEQPDDAERALKILDSVENDFSIDKSRECLVGLSMGGAGAWDIAAKNPKRWAALVPVSAMVNLADAPKVTSIPTWVFHASVDPLVATQTAREMVDAVNAAGGRAYFSEVTKRAHDLSNVVFTQSALTDWMLDPSKPPKLDLDWTEPKGYNNGHEQELPFIPGAEMARAIRFRVCKDVMEALSFAAPEKLAAKPMAGYVGGVYQSAKIGGFLPIDVALSGLHYQGHVERMRIIPQAPNRLIIQAGLRNLTMTVSNSQLNGKLLLSASAGPMNVVIGHRAPVWLTAELQPTVVDRKVRLNLTGVDFRIPNDNWYVTQPSQVHVRGLPFLNGKVSDGLVDGIYNRKGDIERQVMNSVPTMIQTFETKLNEVVFNKITCVGQIAMPMWQPRMKTFPEELIIDDDGITIVSGVTLGTLGQVPKDFKMLKYDALPGFPPPIKTGLEVAVAETLVSAWSELIMAGKVNSFNVYDFSPKEYHALADRDFLQQVIPDLKKYGEDMEGNVVFRLRDPIRLKDPRQNGEPKLLDNPYGNPLTLSLTSVPLTVSVRKKGEPRWTTVGELQMAIDRDYAPYVRKNGFARRNPKFAELGPFRIETKWSFAESYKPEESNVDEAHFLASILKAREAAQLLEGVKPDSVHDAVLNGVPVRMDAMDWVQQHLIIQYQLPGVLVTNDSPESLTYEVRGPHTDWSKSRTLKPGEFDEYHVPYSLTWRRRGAGDVAQLYTLPMGKEVSYRTDPKPGMVLINPEDLDEDRIVPQ